MRLWKALVEAGEPEGLVPAGLGARDTLRLEVAYRLYGNDMDDATTPLEAGLGWVVKLDKGDFIGRDAMLRQKAGGLPRKLVGLRPHRPRHRPARLRRAPRRQEGGDGDERDPIPYPQDLHRPRLRPAPLAAEGSTFAVDVRGRPASAQVVKTPFYTRKRP